MSFAPPLISMCYDKQQHTWDKIRPQTCCVEDAYLGTVLVRPTFHQPAPLFRLLTALPAPAQFTFFPRILVSCVASSLSLSPCSWLQPSPSGHVVLVASCHVPAIFTLWFTFRKDNHGRNIYGQLLDWTVLYARASNPIFFFIYFVNITSK